jgi:hypothetical protein
MGSDWNLNPVSMNLKKKIFEPRADETTSSENVF